MLLKKRLIHNGLSLMKTATEILESYFQNGLTNYSCPQNKILINELVANNDDVFKSTQQVKRWIDRRKQKERKKKLTFDHDVREDTTIPTPDKITTLKLDQWENFLFNCPLDDKQWVLQGIKSGFSLDFDPATPLSSAKKNLVSANSQPEVIDDYLEKELAYGTMIGPYIKPPFENSQINRFGIIPKSNGKWRLITDLSYPHGFSVNDGISQEHANVSYTGLSAAVEKVLSFGKGCLLAKFDIQRAYRMIALKESERHLLVMKWKDVFYVDLALPFGARSAPRIFTRFSDVLEWILKTHGPIQTIQHSLDDFFICGPPDTQECHDALLRAFELCDTLGVPIEHKKTEGPSTCIIFLGLEIDTDAMEIRIPIDKLEKIRSLLEEWVSRRSGTKRSLLSLAGSLYYCCQAVVHGRQFVNRLIHRAYCVEKLYHKVVLEKDEVEDLMWWFYLLNSWNGRSLLSDFDSKNAVRLNS